VSRLTDIQADLVSFPESVYSDADAAKSLSDITLSVLGDSPILAVSNALAVLGAWGKIKDDVANHSDKPRREFLQKVLYLFETGNIDTLGWGDDPTYPTVIEETLDGLISYGYVNADFKAFVMAQRFVQVPKYNPPVHHSEVAAARGRP
jgi:hypothetical protein